MKTIILIGMMGSGKTTVGKLLANRAGLEFIDVDYEIEKKEGLKITEIFQIYGEEYFRKLENSLIKSVFKENGLVMSLGGGAFENSNTRELLSNSNIIYLKTSPSVIFERLKHDDSRPLLKDNMCVEKIDDIIAKRQNNYELAKYVVSTDSKEPQEIVEEILGVLK